MNELDDDQVLRAEEPAAIPPPQRLLVLYPRGEHPVIDQVEAALRDVGVRSRWAAEQYLPPGGPAAWAYDGELTLRERAAVLARFPDALCTWCRGPIEFVPVPPTAGPAFGPPYWRHTHPTGGGHPARPDGTPDPVLGPATAGPISVVREHMAMLANSDRIVPAVFELLGNLVEVWDWPLYIDMNDGGVTCQGSNCPNVHVLDGLDGRVSFRAVLAELAEHARTHRAAS